MKTSTAIYLVALLALTFSTTNLAFALQVVYSGGSVVDLELGYSNGRVKYHLYRDGEIIGSDMVTPQEFLYYSDTVPHNSTHTYYSMSFTWDSKTEEWKPSEQSDPVEVDTSFHSGALYNKVDNRFKRAPIAWSGDIQTKYLNVVNGVLEIAPGSNIRLGGSLRIYGTPNWEYPDADAALLVRDATFTPDENSWSAQVLFVRYDGATRSNTPIEGCVFERVAVDFGQGSKNVRFVNNYFADVYASVNTGHETTNILIQNNINLGGENYITAAGEQHSIIGNTIYGIVVYGAYHEIKDNRIEDRLLLDADSSDVERCTAKEVDIQGDNNHISDCVVENHAYTGHPEVGALGITWGHGNTISHNIIRDNKTNGILLSRGSQRNTITQNIVEHNRIGLVIYGNYYPDMVDTENEIYDNIFRNNTQQSVLDDGAENQWNLDPRITGRNIIGGSFIGGNYYSDYEGVDLNNDGSGDTPHPIPGTAGSVDQYPLVGLDGYRLEIVVLPPQGGTVRISPEPEDGVYQEGDQVTLTANPAEGYLFEQWTGRVNSRENPVTFTMDRDERVYAVFTPDDDSNGKAHGELEDPVNTATGEYYFRLPLFNLGGPMPLAFHLYYGSNVHKKTEVSQAFSHIMGQNWLHNFCILQQTTQNQRIKIIYENGRILTFAWDPEEIGWALWSSEDTPYQLRRVVDGWLLLDPRKGRIHKFNLNGRLIRISDRQGNTHEITYNADGLLDKVEDGLGRSLHFQYEGTKLSAVSDGYGRRISFEYTENGLLTSIAEESLGRTTSIEYDESRPAFALITRIVRPKGNYHYRQTYNDLGQVVSQADVFGNATDIDYDNDGTTHINRPDGSSIAQIHTGKRILTGYIDAEGKEVQIGYDGSNRRSSLVDRYGDQTHIDYDPASGHEASITNAKGDAMDMVYQAQTQTINNGEFTFQNLVRVTHPDDSFVEFTYDDRGNMLSRSDAEGHTWTYTYNSRGQILTETNPAGGVMTYVYYDDGLLKSRSDSETGDTTFTYDEYKRRTKTTRPDGSFTEIQYNPDNQILSSKDEKGRIFTYQYDENGNLIEVTDPNGNLTRYVYDQMDRLVQATDKSSGVVKYEYDSMGRQSVITDPNSLVTRFHFNPNGWLVGLERGGETWRTFYDDEGIVSSRSTPLSATTVYQSDA
ncbi:MAG: NosD domain-containing protein, partial [bacterium]